MFAVVILAVFAAVAIASNFIPDKPTLTGPPRGGIALGTSTAVIGLIGAWYSWYQAESGGVFLMPGEMRSQFVVDAGRPRRFRRQTGWP